MTDETDSAAPGAKNRGASGPHERGSLLHHLDSAEKAFL
jgi:hypothetical protein